MIVFHNVQVAKTRCFGLALSAEMKDEGQVESSSRRERPQTSRETRRLLQTVTCGSSRAQQRSRQLQQRRVLTGGGPGGRGG